MNSTKILFLKVLRGDIKRQICERMKIDPSQMSLEDEKLLAGQTIKRSDIEDFSSYRLMNDDERTIVNSILNDLKNKGENESNQRGKALLKQIDSLVPSTFSSDAIEYKDAA